ncbi:MAG: hypothetical protein QW795_07270 [Candidatus Bathyarchaeia archaeon]
MALLKLDTKVCHYPPEVFPVADSVNLLPGDNIMLEYTSLKVRKQILSLYGYATIETNASLYVLADEKEVMRTDLRASLGIDANNETRLSANNSLLINVRSTSSLNNFKSRFLIRIDRATPLVRKYYNLPLDDRDIEILNKYDIKEVVSSEFNPYQDNVYEIITIGRRLNSSGTVFKEKAGKNEKISIVDIAITKNRPDFPDRANIVVYRDGLEPIIMDASCMPYTNFYSGGRHLSTCRMTAVDEIEVRVETNQDIGLRLTYIVGKLTVEEKVKWGLKLSQEEQRYAEKNNLFELAEVGLI